MGLAVSSLGWSGGSAVKSRQDRWALLSTLCWTGESCLGWPGGSCLWAGQVCLVVERLLGLAAFERQVGLVSGLDRCALLWKDYWVLLLWKDRWV